MKHLILPSLSFVFALACGSANAPTIPMETTPRSPAAVGVVDVKRDSNQNTIGKIRVEHLAPPREIREDLNVYVAWVRPTGEETWQNVGQLRVDQSREGTLEVRVPHDKFELSVSAENNGDVVEPSEFIVMRTNVDSRTAS